MRTVTVKIKELAEIKSGGTPNTSKNEFWNGEIPWITPADLSVYDKVYIAQGERNITDIGLKKSSAVLLPKGTILLSSRAPIGYLAIAQNSLCTNQGFKNLVCNKKPVNNIFLYYYLKQNIAYIKNFASGATFPELSKTRLKNIKISICSDIDVQNKIADILSKYDDLIENNNKRINALEQMAENLYKEWFVRFRFPGHESAEFENGIPKGWEVKRISDIANVGAGGDAPKNQTPIKTTTNFIPIYSNSVDDNGLYGYTDKARVTKKSITISARGTVGFVCLRFEPYCPIVRLLYAVPKIDTDLYYLSYALRINSIEGYGTSQQQITIPYFNRKKILYPKAQVIEQFAKIVDSFYQKIRLLSAQNQNLIKQRDLLLPRLMSGKLEVTNENN